MKKLVFSIAAVAIIGLGVATTIYSCSNDEDGTTNGKHSKITYAGVPVSTFSYTNHNGESVKMLEFENFQAYWETRETLRAKIKQHNKTFFDNYALTHTLTDSTVLWVDSLDFEPEQPLADFENSLGFHNSMRKDFNAYEEAWLVASRGKDLDMTKAPASKFPVGRAERTLLNGGGEVKYGDTIMKMTNDGYFLITDGDITTLNKFNDGDTTVLGQDNVINNMNKSNNNCRLSVKTTHTAYMEKVIVPNQLSWKFKITFGINYQYYGLFSNSFAEANLYAQLINYANNPSTNWGKANAFNQEITNTTHCGHSDCASNYFVMSDTDSGTAYSVDVSCSQWWMKGYVANGQSINIYYKILGIYYDFVAIW
ncbi:MAG: hypothetical protein LBO06_03790 [Bacteroidales bacterium]|jgi:hypothetical protein|nr:hypothetical protein [Bacteroidales bacterium]